MYSKMLTCSIAATTLCIVNACSSSDSGEMADPILLDPVITDPAPQFQQPGEYGCDGCPDSDISEFELSTRDSTNLFSGVVNGAAGNGEFYIVGDDNSSISGPLPTNGNGAFSFNAPLFCGRQIIKCVWSNETGSYVLITEVTREDCTNADIQITLNWDDLGDDFELHLVKPGGSLNDSVTDCTWTTCIGQGPDWGVQGDSSDDPRKDVDNTGSYGPENIFLASPENGLYTVFVEHWGGGDPSADGEVIINVAGETTVATVQDLASRHVWNVGTIAWPSAEVTLNGAIVDCTDSWSGGCRLDLPGVVTQE